VHKLKVMTVVGTRPEIIRLSRTIEKLDSHCEHILVHTGQNFDFELNGIFFEDLGIRKPDHFLEAAGCTAVETIGKVIIALDALLEQLKPDALLVLGDTNSCMAVIPAKRRKIPTFHMEAGNRCFDQRVPEEINRRIVDHTADVNLTYSDIARSHLLREGLPPDLVIKTGSPMLEVLSHHRSQIDASDVLERLDLKARGYFLVSAHREENVDPEPSFQRLTQALNLIGETYELPVIVSTHPRTQKRIDASGVSFGPLVRLLKPLGFTDYNKLQICSAAVLSDSGTITEEAAILNFPALNLRETHERPEGMEEAAAMMVGLNPDRIIQGLAVLDSQPRGSDRLIRLPSDYDVPNVSDKVLRIIHSYVDYVNRIVWKKY
jgi:UDP-N-acetyl-L-fucosamine synthase